MKKVQAFTFDELTKEQQKDFIEAHRDINDTIIESLLYDDMKEFIEEKLKELYLDDTVKLGDVIYSLSYNQGDGVSFDAEITKKNGDKLTIGKNNGYYCHEMGMTAELMNEEGEIITRNEERDDLDTMRDIAKEAEKYGYTQIEYQTTDEAIIETIRANEYHFIPSLGYKIA